MNEFPGQFPQGLRLSLGTEHTSLFLLKSCLMVYQFLSWGTLFTNKQWQNLFGTQPFESEPYLSGSLPDPLALTLGQ